MTVVAVVLYFLDVERPVFLMLDEGAQKDHTNVLRCGE